MVIVPLHPVSECKDFFFLTVGAVVFHFQFFDKYVWNIYLAPATATAAGTYKFSLSWDLQSSAKDWQWMAQINKRDHMCNGARLQRQENKWRGEWTVKKGTEKPEDVGVVASQWCLGGAEKAGQALLTGLAEHRDPGSSFDREGSEGRQRDFQGFVALGSGQKGK